MHDNKTVFLCGEGVREGLLRNPADAKIRRRGKPSRRLLPSPARKAAGTQAVSFRFVFVNFKLEHLWNASTILNRCMPLPCKSVVKSSAKAASLTSALSIFNLRTVHNYLEVGEGVAKLEGGIGENDNKREGGWM